MIPGVACVLYDKFDDLINKNRYFLNILTVRIDKSVTGQKG
ncbi:hypothetical protein CHCC14814_3115 [Bacillus paralicheniformis]|nr:hypothetical protein CHCC14814_3115 [Bacillus paralicheniformis]